jgi:hypothetical protein
VTPVDSARLGERLQLPDFTLRQLEIRGGRMARGFAHASSFSASHLRDPKKGQE